MAQIRLAKDESGHDVVHMRFSEQEYNDLKRIMENECYRQEKTGEDYTPLVQSYYESMEDK